MAELNTEQILSDILEEGKDLLKELYETIDDRYTSLIERNFQNLVKLAGEYAIATVQGDKDRAETKRESIEHSIASIISVALTAVSQLVGEARTIAYTRLSELLAYLSTQLIVQLNTAVAQSQA